MASGSLLTRWSRYIRWHNYGASGQLISRRPVRHSGWVSRPPRARDGDRTSQSRRRGSLPAPNPPRPRAPQSPTRSPVPNSRSESPTIRPSRWFAKPLGQDDHPSSSFPASMLPTRDNLPGTSTSRPFPRAGVHLVYGDDVWPLHQPRSAPNRQLPWAEIRRAIDQATNNRVT